MQIGLKQAVMAPLSFKSKENGENPKKQELIKGIEVLLAKAGVKDINIPKVVDQLLETEKRIEEDRKTIPLRIESLNKKI